MVIEDIIKQLKVNSFLHGSARLMLVGDAIHTVKDMTAGYCLRPISLARGQSMPQTVEYCQAIMERDGDMIQEQDKEIKLLKARIIKLERKLLVSKAQLTKYRSRRND